MKRVLKAQGFRFAGMHAGVKVERKDLALIASDRPAAAVAVVTQSQLRAACVERTEALLPRGDVRAVVVNSGNANCLTDSDRADDLRMAEAVAAALGVEAAQVVTASTGSIGEPLPVDRIAEATPELVQALSDDVYDAAEAILTTDRTTKVASRQVELGGGVVTVTAVAKGSGMIHPNMATMLAFLCTDAACPTSVLARVLKPAVEETFNQITVDRDTSTNDMVVLLANGASGVAVDEGTDGFVRAVYEVCLELAREIAGDGEGATRLLSVHVTQADSVAAARALSRAVASSNLVKSSLFGDMSGWGRCLAVVGACAHTIGLTLERQAVSMAVNGELEFERGRPTGRKGTVTGPEVRFEISLGRGEASAWAWGCDLSYDYVSINAVSKSQPLDTHSPGLKRRLLVDCLSYIKQFANKLAVIKYGGAAMLREDLKDAFAEDIVLLKAAGLLPVVVHGGGPEISRTLERLGEKTTFVDGLRVTDSASMKVVEMVLTGSVNTDVVTRMHRFGGAAIGISGKDGALLSARKITPKGRDLGMVGEVAEVRTKVITMLLADGYVPVISPVGVDAHGTTYNINADNVAAEVAVALKAEKLLFLTDVPGVMEGDKKLSRATPDVLRRLIDKGVVEGGMVPKCESLTSAVERGVHSAHIIDGRVPHNLLAELFTDQGVGTWIKRSFDD